MEDASGRRIARRIAVGALTVAVMLVLASALVTLLPGGAAPMPPVIWVQGADSLMDRDLSDRDVRVGSADRPGIGEIVQCSVFTGGWGPSGDESRDGVSLARPGTDVDKRKRDLADRGLIPLHREPRPATRRRARALT